MVLSKSDLIASINNVIKANGVGAITGDIANGIFNQMTQTLYSTYFSYPHTSLTDADVGKIVMNDGTGNAAVYQLTPKQDAQAGVFQLHLTDTSSFGSSTSVTINNNTQSYTVTYNMITNKDGSAPSTMDEVFNNIKTAFASIGLTGYSFSNDDVNGILTITEQSYNNTMVNANGINNNIDIKDNTDATTSAAPSGVTVVAYSLPALPAAPTRYPMGKLMGIDGNQAFVSSAYIEVYTLAQPFTFLNSLFDYATVVPLTVGNIESTVSLIIQPWTNGTAMPLDITQYDFNNFTFQQLRQQFIGIAIGATETTVTVINIPYVSFLLSLGLRFADSGLFSN